MNKKYIFILIFLVSVALVYKFYPINKSQVKVDSPIVNSNKKDLEFAKDSTIAELKTGDSFDLTASVVKKNINGKELKMLAYNGQIPGPLIKVKKGSEITINFTNNIDMDSTVHSHGIRLDNKFDGVPDVTQDPVKIGEKYVYKLKFPDVGMYWYHPHVREDYQQELGLYGNYLVTPDNENYWNPVNQEVALFLDDILLGNNGEAEFSNKVVDHAFMGRYGNVMLINGDTNYSLNMNKGDVARLYLTNSANTRIFHFMMPGVKFKQVGGDNGKYEKEEFVDGVIIGPSERYIVEAYFDKSGEFEIQHKTPEKTYSLGKVNVSSDSSSKSYASEFNSIRNNYDVATDIKNVVNMSNNAVQKKLTISIDPMGMGGNMMGGDHMMHGGMMMGNNNNQKIEWEDSMGMMNKNSIASSIKWKFIDQENKNENMDIHWSFKKGDLVNIKVFNDPKSMHPMQHPIHIHGQRFLVLNTNGVKNSNQVWKDTTLIQSGDTAELLVDMSNLGDWLIHCHVPEHMESGMMSKFSVT